ncbi:NADP-dependent oxidoreductase domain-containing protein [Xylaria digitata]|nr:NADP-dependent oxidoreductase domain-containing protein [Xylaria digitata]
MAAAQSLPPTGYGMLGLTWRPTATPDEQAFAAMKASINNGATVWSTSSVYGMPPNPPTAGIQLIRRYFDKYPEDASKVTLFIRGCFNPAKRAPATDREGVLASFEECSNILGDAKKIDVFGPARIDQNVPVEVTIGALKELLDQGKISAIGLSEVRAETIKRAAAVAPIKFAEAEFSLWCTEILSNGVAAAAKEAGVTLLAYAPLGYGFLTGAIKSLEDVPQGDLRRFTGRFQPENFKKNLDLVDKVKDFAERKGATPAQLALAWIRAHSNTETTGTIIPIPGATHESRVNENTKVVEISAEELTDLDKILQSIEVVGHRHIPGADHLLYT